MKTRNSSQAGKRSSSQAAKPQSPKSAEKTEVCDICLKKPATTQVPGFHIYLCSECEARQIRNQQSRTRLMLSELLGAERSAQVAHQANQNGGAIQCFMRSAVDHYLEHLNPDAANHGEGMRELIGNRDAGAIERELSPDGINALYQVSAWYERIREGGWDNGINWMNGLYEMLRHNPQFQLEAQAVRGIWEAAAVLSTIQDRINLAVDGPRLRQSAVESGKEVAA